MSCLTKPPRLVGIGSVRKCTVKYVCNLGQISCVFTIAFNCLINGETLKKKNFCINKYYTYAHAQ